MKLIRYTFKVVKVLLALSSNFFSQVCTRFRLLMNGVSYEKGLKSFGIPLINVSIGGTFSIGKKFMMNNGTGTSITGQQIKCLFWVSKDATLRIGDNVGMNSTSIGCFDEIIIGSNIRVGGGTIIYDTNFHSIKVEERIADPEILDNVKTARIEIKDGAFIGAKCIISKGVTIGENAVVAAGSVVIRDIPDNEIWGGNPAKFIKKLN